MKVSYRDHDIEVKREKCLGGWSMVYYSIFRKSDGYECTSGCLDTEDTVRDMIKFSKERVDSELESDDPWGEKSDCW